MHSSSALWARGVGINGDENKPSSPPPAAADGMLGPAEVWAELGSASTARSRRSNGAIFASSVALRSCVEAGFIVHSVIHGSKVVDLARG